MIPSCLEKRASANFKFEFYDGQIHGAINQNQSLAFIHLTMSWLIAITKLLIKFESES